MTRLCSIISCNIVQLFRSEMMFKQIIQLGNIQILYDATKGGKGFPQIVRMSSYGGGGDLAKRHKSFIRRHDATYWEKVLDEKVIIQW